MKAKSKIARSKPRGHVEILSPLQVESALKHILTSTLALYVLNSKNRPAVAIKDLMNIECEAAQLVGLIMQLRAENVSAPNLEGVLAGVFSYIPISTTKLKKRTRSSNFITKHQ